MEMRKKIGWILAYVLTLGGALAAVHGGNQAVKVVSENMGIPRKTCIVIDAGHGGEDGGAISCTGRMESEYNLEISLRLRDLLHLLGYKTIMIRTTDESVCTTGETIAARKSSDLKNRVKIVNDTPQALLLSIHQNQFPDSRYQGAQVFYAGTQGSHELAVQLQTELVDKLNRGSHRKAKRSNGVYLMEKIINPGVLIECGFLSNYEEEARLANPSYQKKLCSVIVCTLDQFLSGA